MSSQRDFEPERTHKYYGSSYSSLDLGKLEIYVRDNLKKLYFKLPSYNMEIKNDVFEMRPYYSGDCTCGFNRIDSRWWKEHPHDSNCMCIELYRFNEEMTRRGVILYSKEYVRRFAGFFESRGFLDCKDARDVYCTCGVEYEYDRWRRKNRHDKKCLRALPNFKHYSSGIEIRWFLVIGRGMSINMVVEMDEMLSVFKECFKSLEISSKIMHENVFKNSEGILDTAQRKDGVNGYSGLRAGPK